MKNIELRDRREVMMPNVACVTKDLHRKLDRGSKDKNVRNAARKACGSCIQKHVCAENAKGLTASIGAPNTVFGGIDVTASPADIVEAQNKEPTFPFIAGDRPQKDTDAATYVRVLYRADYRVLPELDESKRPIFKFINNQLVYPPEELPSTAIEQVSETVARFLDNKSSFPISQIVTAARTILDDAQTLSHEGIESDTVEMAMRHSIDYYHEVEKVKEAARRKSKKPVKRQFHKPDITPQPEEERMIVSDKNALIARAIVIAEETNNLSTQEICQASGISISLYNRIKQGQTNIPLLAYKKLVDLLDNPSDAVDAKIEKIESVLEDKRPEERNKAIGPQLIDISSGVGMSQRDIAQAISKSREAVTAINAGRASISVGDARTILREVQERRNKKSEAIMELRADLVEREDEQRNPSKLTTQKAMTRLRETFNISQTQLAELIPELNQIAISRIESGKRNMSGVGLVAIIDAFQELEVPLEDPSIRHLIQISGFIATTDEAIRIIKSDKSVSWQRVSKVARRGLIEKTADELGTPILSLDTRNFTKTRLTFIGGKSLSGLYANAAKDPRRKGKDTTVFIIERAGITITTEMVVEALKQDKINEWRRIPENLYHDLLQLAAQERKKPIVLLTQPDLDKPFDFLGGNTLRGFEDYGTKNKKSGQSNMVFILEKAGVTLTLDDIRYIFHSDQETRCRWELASSETFYELFEQIARETGIPVALIGSQELQLPLTFLNGHTLTRLLTYSTRQGRKQDETAMVWLKRKAEIPEELTFEDVQNIVKRGNKKCPWDRISSEAIREIFEHISTETGVPVKLIGSQEFFSSLSFLNGRTLRGFYNYSLQERGEDEGPLDWLRKRIGIPTELTFEDLQYISQTEDMLFPWKRVPPETIGEIFEHISTETGVPVKLIGSRELISPLSFLNGRTLAGLYYYCLDQQREKNESAADWLRKRIGIPTELTFEDLQYISQTEDMLFPWKQVPPETIGEIFEHISLETGIPIALVSVQELYLPFQFLNGRSPRGLFEYFLRQKGEESQTAISLLKRKAGVPHESGQRSNYRKTQMQKLFTEEMPEHRVTNHSAEDFLPWIISVSDIYERPYLDIKKEEIQNELYLFVAEMFTDVDNSFSSEEIVAQAHQFIEKYVSSSSTRRYREKLLSTKIDETNLTFEEALPNQEAPLPAEKTIFSRKIETVLENLSPLERALIIGITVDGWTFDDMVEEINRTKEQFQLEEDVDSDMLQEYFNDALLTLQIEFDPIQ